MFGCASKPEGRLAFTVCTNYGYWLHALWILSGLVNLEERILRARRTFHDFEDYWSTTIAAPNLAPMLKTMSWAEVAELKSRVRKQAPIETNGSVSVEAHANAIVGRSIDNVVYCYDALWQDHIQLWSKIARNHCAQLHPVDDHSRTGRS